MRLRNMRKIVRRKTKRWVYAAWDSATRTRVAVKKFGSRMEALRERDVMRSYPVDAHLVRYYDFFVRTRRRGGLRAYIVMEWAKGAPLLTVVKRRGALRREKVIAIALDILAGLDVLHRSGFVHGDLHHKNIIVTSYRDAATKLIDFQMSVRKDWHGNARARRVLRRPPIKLAPESKQRTIDDSYDIYGVGYVCALMMTGRVPRRRPRMTRRRLHDRALWRVIRKAMHKNPKRRYRSAAEMMDALRAVSDDIRHRTA